MPMKLLSRELLVVETGEIITTKSKERALEFIRRKGKKLAVQILKWTYKPV